jgi:hypothetical protein
MQNDILPERYSYLVKGRVVQRVFTGQTTDAVRAEELLSHARGIPCGGMSWQAILSLL